MEHIIQEFFSNINTYSYFAVFMAMLLTGIGLPLPGELTLGLTGYFVYSGQLTMLPAIAAAALGDLLGAVFSYGIGFFSRSRIIARHFSFLIPPESKVKVIEKWLNKYGISAVVFGRSLPVIRGVIPISAGFVQMPGKHYMIGISSSSILWCSALIYLGMRLGYNWQLLSGLVKDAGWVIVGLLVISVVGWYLARKG